jgi:MoxR-like ATPase
MSSPTQWHIFQGHGRPHPGIQALPPPPRWRPFHEEAVPVERTPPGQRPQIMFGLGQRELELINAAILLRRPLLVTGKPGTGKSSLANAIAYELGLGQVLEWPITTRTALQEGLFEYDAIARAQEGDGRDLAEIGNYLRLGPLGTALLPSKRPRVLLIDEIDKGDIDLPNDLLHVFEKGWFEIPPLARLPDTHSRIRVRPHDSLGRDDVVTIERGRVRCLEFPIVLLTSNGERDFSPAFLRRCIRLDIQAPDEKNLAHIIRELLGPTESAKAEELIRTFTERQKKEELLATDQLLNAVYLAMHHEMKPGALLDALFRSLS